MALLPLIQSLEPRTYFAGLTLLANGRLGDDTGWVQTMTNEITARLGGASQVTQYVMTLEPNPTTGALIPTVTQVAGTASPQNNPTGQIILIVNWYDISANPVYNTATVGSVVGNYLLNTPVDGITLASLPIHEVGLSRGAGLMDQISLTLGQAGVWVDQQTYLDPDPLAVMNDPPPTLYDNVAFADNYWRNDGTGSSANNGQPVTGAHNLNVYWLDSTDTGYPLAHLTPAGYYNGTIDLTATNGGDGPIYSQWYGSTDAMPARDATGFIYTSIGGAARPTDGLWAASGGTGARTAAGQVGPQWGNITDLAVANGSAFVAGDSIHVNYLHEDRGGADTVTYYLAKNANPFSGSFVATVGTQSVPGAPYVTDGSAILDTTGVPDGKYFICAAITDSAGQTRYAYANSTVVITSAAKASFQTSVVLPSNVDAVPLGLLSGFSIQISERVGSKIIRTTAQTDNTGTLTFIGLTPAKKATITFLSKTGYGLLPKLKSKYTISLPAGALTVGGLFSVELIQPGVGHPKKGKK